MNRRTRDRVRVVAWLTLALSAVGLEAQAQRATAQGLVAAQTLYEQALAAMDRKDFATACPRLEEVVRLVPEAVGAKLTLAGCYEADGRLASAWSTYLAAEAAAMQVNQTERQSAARARAEALRPTLAEVTIVVPDSVRALPGLKIACDGDAVPQAQWGSRFPIDKGKHAVTATADGMSPWTGVAEIEADGVEVTVEIGELRRAVAPKSRGKPPRSTVAAPRTNGPVPRGEDSWAWPWGAQRTAGIVAGGLGMVSLGIGAVFGIVAVDRKNASHDDGHCQGDLCDAVGMRLRGESMGAGMASTVMLIAGGLTLAAGVTLFTTAPGEPDKAAGELAVGPRGATLRMRW